MAMNLDDWTDEELAFLEYWQRFDAPFPGTESREFIEWKKQTGDNDAI